jgi:RimJ/RimL family protein N-acetyltransferase
MPQYITNSTMEDIETIFQLYDAATEYQKTVFHRQWKGFERSLIETEIQENRQWKIVVDGKIACIFAITFSDVLFWKEKDSEPSIYIHRIATNPAFRGNHYVKNIINWGKSYCKRHEKDFIRMDTWSDNPKLVAYYEKCGFKLVGTIDIDNTEGLPKHYEGSLALFEIVV